MDASHASELLASQRRRSWAARVFLGVNAVGAAVMIAHDVSRLGLFNRLESQAPPSTAEINASDALTTELGVASLVLLLVTGAAFVLWVRSAYRVARDGLDATGLEHDAAAAGWSFVIPFTNLYKPLGVMQALERASDPSALPVPAPERARPEAHYRAAATAPEPAPWSVTGPLELWWFLFVGSRIGGQMASRIATTQPTLDQLRTQTYAFFLVNLGYAAAAVLAIRVVRAIDLQQHEKARRLAAMPKPPPDATDATAA